MQAIKPIFQVKNTVKPTFIIKSDSLAHSLDILNGYVDFMNKYENDFIENLVYYRTQKGLSQLELSGICDCAKSTIGGIESRKNFPSFELILKIAYALEIHPADLFLRNASTSRREVREFFEKDVLKMVQEKFPEEGSVE